MRVPVIEQSTQIPPNIFLIHSLIKIVLYLVVAKQ
jgi:hypothetical protein